MSLRPPRATARSATRSRSVVAFGIASTWLVACGQIFGVTAGTYDATVQGGVGGGATGGSVGASGCSASCGQMKGGSAPASGGNAGVGAGGGVGGSTGGFGNGGSGPPACLSTMTCLECQTCEQTGACAMQWNACHAQPQCASTAACVLGCQSFDTACRKTCLANAAAGFDPNLFAAFTACATCGACSIQCVTSCSGTGGAGGGNPGGSGGVAGSSATACAHDPCAAGPPLDKFCDPCVTAICNQKPSCCVSGWDDGCRGLAAPTCNLMCGMGGGGVGGAAGGAGAPPCSSVGIGAIPADSLASSCASCTSAAEASACANPSAACLGGAACAAVHACADGCPTPGCSAACEAKHPAGTCDYEVYHSCILAACPSSCGPRLVTCPGGKACLRLANLVPDDGELDVCTGASGIGLFESLTGKGLRYREVSQLLQLSTGQVTLTVSAKATGCKPVPGYAPITVSLSMGALKTLAILGGSITSEAAKFVTLPLHQPPGANGTAMVRFFDAFAQTNGTVAIGPTMGAGVNPIFAASFGAWATGANTDIDGYASISPPGSVVYAAAKGAQPTQPFWVGTLPLLNDQVLTAYGVGVLQAQPPNDPAMLLCEEGVDMGYYDRCSIF